MDSLSVAVEASGLQNVHSIREAVDQRLGEWLPLDATGRDQVANAMRGSVLPAGKRVRPLLLVMAAQGLGCSSPSLIDLGCAVEMVHASSLIIDDMPCMDDAQVRRGRPTIHREYGEDVAVLAAIALLTKAFSLVSSLPNVSAALRAQLVTELANAVGMQGLVHGQYKDLREGATQRSAQDIATTNELKTGVLFGAALNMAALVADATDTQRQSLTKFAQELGQAFQLLDDLRDGATDTGKDPLQDEGKSTLVTLLGPDAARKQLLRHITQADASLTAVYGPNQAVSRFMHKLFDQALAPR
ncbi:polyprenyl synthetase family protein [Pseudomonas sp. gcc21]|uniref:polyprenyl synthetase family protein n=1 Tax=Pseudomonas sp. gcc21 TaxID=2726989 RepID=UPI00145192A6|nr:polyprenyl synthetase family protein [Pseudomonas sp. gcc21]QJD58912.1 polyprenyl synthetase family protein [Pseudomonas sp. gcc21]